MKVNEIISSVKDGTKEFLENFVKYGKTSVITVILSLVIALSACLAVFFASVQGAEKVLVPDVVGESLTDALLKMQAKELYPKIQLKYSDSPGDK